jgi:hypothetical protein
LVWKSPSLGKHGACGEEAVRVALKEKLASAPLYKQRWAPRQDHLEAELLHKSLIAHWKIFGKTHSLLTKFGLLIFSMKQIFSAMLHCQIFYFKNLFDLTRAAEPPVDLTLTQPQSLLQTGPYRSHGAEPLADLALPKLQSLLPI